MLDSEDIVKLNLQDGDLLFVNLETVDIEALRRLTKEYSGPKHWFVVPILPNPGQTVSDCVVVARQHTDHIERVLAEQD